MALVGLGCVGAWAVLGSPGLPAAQQVTGAVVVLGSAALLAIKLRFLRLTGQSNQSLAQQQQQMLKTQGAELRRLGEDLTRAKTALEAAAQHAAESRSQVATATRTANDAMELAVHTGTTLRHEIEGRLTDVGAVAPVAVRDAPHPLLSVAVPGFNRPSLLEECLASIVAELECVEPGTVEIVVTDDQSPDRRAAAVAAEFARMHPFVGLRINSENLGLEANLLEAARGCRGEYLWIFGNDDRWVPSGFAQVLEDIRAAPADVLLFEKSRIGLDGRPLPDREGNAPIKLDPGQAHRFDRLVDVGTYNGVNSSLGWISQVVMRRKPFMAVDPEPYLGLTMYPQLAMMLQAFGDRPLFYRNHRAALHRSPTAPQRLAELLGRREATFWQVGRVQRARWFGASYAALLQRVVDRSGLETTDFANHVERLWTKQPLVDWVESNWREGLADGLELPGEWLSDARRFFAILGRTPPE